MKPDDLKRIGGSVLLAIVMSVAGGMAVLVSGQRAEETRHDHARATAARGTAQNGLAAARAEEAEIAQKIDRYARLAARGAIGTERRLVWVELIRDARARHRLGALDYEFSPRRPIDRSISPADAGQFEVASSTLRLKLPLLHEGDLITLLDDLARHAPALVRTRECSITRRAATDTSRETLQADCLLDWITFSPATKDRS
jgi:hypothetical protein